MWWLVIKILWSLLPAIIQAVKEQKIKKAAHDEIVIALNKRIEDARKAEIPDEATDRYNRNNAVK